MLTRLCSSKFLNLESWDASEHRQKGEDVQMVKDRHFWMQILAAVMV